MKARDVMTRDVLTAYPDMTVQDAAAVMAEKHISGLPVVTKEGEVIGIISEGDLIHRAELGTGDEPANWSRYFTDPKRMAEAFAKAHGAKVRDVMTRPVHSVDVDADLHDVADALEAHRMKRVPVMSGGKLVGIIARSDLVRALSRAVVTSSPEPRQGGNLREVIEREMKALSWLDTSYLNMTVFDGVVRLRGFVQSNEHLDALRILLEGTSGVVAVETSNVSIGTPALNWDGEFA